MKRLWSLGLGILFVAGSANAQFVVDSSARTISLNYTTTDPTQQTFSQLFSGTLNTSGLATLFGSDPITLHFDPTLSGPGGAYSANQMPLLVNASGGTILDLPGDEAATIGATFTAGDHSGVVNQDYADWEADEQFLSGPEPGWGQYFFNGFDIGFPITVEAGTIVPYTIGFGGTSMLAAFGEGATAQFIGTVGLAGVTAYDASGNEVATATFDDLGNGYFTTPEPASTALLATGLLGLVPFARRKKAIT